MKAKWVFASALALCVLLVPVYAQQFGPGVSDHEAWCQIYDKKAKEQDVVIVDHRKMKVQVGKYYGLDTSPSGTMDLAIGREMQAHCDDIIVAAEKLKQEFLKFSEWHKNQSGKSQTQ